MARKGEWVYDELLNYVASPLFQAPVITFMETNCLLFDPSIEDCKEYREFHGGYCALVTVLLEAFRQDTSLTHEQVIKAMTEMSKKDDIREVFSGVFELILASESFRLFVRLMTQKNIDMQQQALLMIMKQYGQVPDVMRSEKPSAEKKVSEKGGAKPPPPKSVVEKQEKEILENIIKSTETQPPLQIKDPGMKNTAEAESKLLQIERQQEEQKLAKVMKELKLEEPAAANADAKASPAAAKATPAAAVSPPIIEAKDQPLNAIKMPRLTCHAPPSTPSVEPPSAPVQSGDAAAQWIAQAKGENAQETVSAAVKSAAATFANITPDELKKRQAYLKEQREKLMARKQQEREKQLSSYEKSTPARPKSSRAARTALSQAPTTLPPAPEKADNQKTMEMRKAIANRLKAEVIGGPEF